MKRRERRRKRSLELYRIGVSILLGFVSNRIASFFLQEFEFHMGIFVLYLIIHITFVSVCFFSITSAGFFTILYSLEWGKEKANEWLTTFLLSFFQSVIVVQPIKVWKEKGGNQNHLSTTLNQTTDSKMLFMSLQVMFLVAFIACILKKPALDEEDTNEDLNNVIAAHDEEFIGKDNGTIEGLTLNQYNKNSFC